MAAPRYQSTPGYPSNSGYPPAPGAGYQSGGYPPSQDGAYPPQGGGYPQGGAYPPQGGAYPPQGGAYPPPQGGAYPHPQSVGYPMPPVSVDQGPPSGAYPPPQAGGYPPAQPTAPVGPTAQPISAWQPQEGMKYQGGDIPTELLSENHSGQEPTAPPLGPPQAFTGYEGASYDTAFLPPPPTYDSLPPPQTPEMAMDEFRGDSVITEEVVREQLLEMVNANSCWGDGPAKDMKLQEIAPMPALHYVMESFSESRVTQYETEPYRGGMIDGPHNGQPPAPWAIPIQPNGHFTPVTLKTEVPHTATVIGCNKCFSQGYIRCWHCHGRGMRRCISCHGNGRRQRTRYVDGEHQTDWESCFSCHGRGMKSCHTCHSSGMVQCNKCEGYRMLKSAIQLTTTFAIETDDYAYERTAMPDELIKTVSGKTVFEQSAQRVGPIIGYKIKEINDKSGEYVQKHATAFPTKRILYQRQQLRAVPVTQIQGKWKDENVVYWIYGDERKVHFPNYPNKCCWNCSIL